MFPLLVVSADHGMNTGQAKTRQERGFLQMVTSETKTEETDTPVEENEEAMLPEDRISLTYVEKQSGTNKKTELK